MNLATIHESQTRDKDSFRHIREINKPFGVLDRVIDWCRTECTGDWRWRLVDCSSDVRPGLYIFYFDSDRDCAAFSLQWC
jgi:hypothetical protein